MGTLCLRGLRRSRRALVLFLVGLLALAQLAGAAATVAAADPLTAQSAIAHSAPKVGATDAQKTITLALSLTPNVNQQQMEAFVQGLSDPKSPTYKHFLTPQAFTAKFLDPAARAQVVAFLKSAGLTVTDSGVGSLVTASGTVAQVEAAFHVALSDYRDASGATFYANDRTPALPVALAPAITAVVGLDNAPAAHSHIALPTHPTPHAVTAKTATGCAGLVNVVNSFGGYAPNQFGTAYDFDALYSAGYKGEGQTLALFELSDWNTSDSDAYKACLGLTTPVNRINVDGGTAVDANGQGEVNLDIDVMLGMLQKMAALNVYVAPNTGTGVLHEYQKIATDNTASVISTSWGICENSVNTFDPGRFAAENTIFMQLQSQGQQLFAASGDDGSEDCSRGGGPTLLNVDDPASQPFVTGVGGTTVTINGTTNAYMNETVWNHDGGGGGGGLSTQWSQPTYQSGPGVSNTYSNGKREVPDMSAPADPNTGYVVFNAGSWTLTGGTSGAAPFSASGFALMNQAFLARGGTRLAFANPTLYTTLTNNASVFHDVTSGNNCAQASGPCVTAGNVYPATANYDMATGVGTPKFGAIANFLVPPGPTLTSISVTPANPSIAIAATQQFAATGTYSDSSTKDITSTVTWASSATAIATITTAGLATGVSMGVTTVSATLNSVSGNTTLTITGPSGLQFYPLSQPVRLYDTRAGQLAFIHPNAALTAGQTQNLPGRFTYQGVTIPVTAQAIVGNATVANGANGTPAGFATIFPGGVSLPLASNLNFVPGTVRPNAFTVALGNDGSFNLYSSSGGDFVIDISGYYAPIGTGGLYFHPLTAPVRELDTRAGGSAFVHPNATLTAGQTVNLPGNFTFNGITVPASAKALVGNATVANNANGTPAGFATLYPNGVSLPLASNLNFVPGTVAPNAFTVALGGDGTYNLYSSSGGDFIIDIAGYLDTTAAGGLLFNPLSAPVRELDTRAGATALRTPNATLTAGQTVNLPGSFTYSGITIPAGAKALVGNATVANDGNATPAGFATLYPNGVSLPLASNLNFVPKQVAPNAFTVGVGSDGTYNLYTSSGGDFVIDISGYFA